jgi:hypothetical protein
MNPFWTALETEHYTIWSYIDDLAVHDLDPRSKRSVARRLVAFQSAHELTEEALLWPLVRQLCPDGDELVDNALDQEHQLKLALHDLDHLAPSSEEFGECAHTVAAHERTHLSYEQSQIWPRMFDALDGPDRDRVTAQWQAMRRAAPTKPHPHLPPTPGLLKMAMPVLAMVDRLS